MQTTHQVDIVAGSVSDWQSVEEDERNRRRRQPKHRKHRVGKTKMAHSGDRSLSFVEAVRKRFSNSLIRCDEVHPQEGPHSVLCVVLESESKKWREQIEAVHHHYFGASHANPLAPVQLEVIDRATHEAIQRLIADGLVARTTRFTRSLWPLDESTMSPPPLSEAEREQAGVFRRQAMRKLKVARVLAAGDLGEEARQALLEAIEPLGRALAVENRLPEPQSLEDTLLPPIGPAWKEALPLVRNFLRETTEPLTPILNVMAQV